MPEKLECQVCLFKQCVSVKNENGQTEPMRLEYIPWMPWVNYKNESVTDCPVRRNPQNYPDLIFRSHFSRED